MPLPLGARSPKPRRSPTRCAFPARDSSLWGVSRSPTTRPPRACSSCRASSSVDATASAGSRSFRVTVPAATSLGAPFSASFEPGAMTPSLYLAAVDAAIASGLDKVVLARDLKARIPADADLRRAARPLERRATRQPSRSRSTVSSAQAPRRWSSRRAAPSRLACLPAQALGARMPPPTPAPKPPSRRRRKIARSTTSPSVASSMHSRPTRPHSLRATSSRYGCPTCGTSRAT